MDPQHCSLTSARGKDQLIHTVPQTRSLAAGWLGVGGASEGPHTTAPQSQVDRN